MHPGGEIDARSGAGRTLGQCDQGTRGGFAITLGPKARRSRLAKELGPLTEKLGTRVRGPVGLDLGAVTPEGIALSIIGQLHAWLAGREYSEAVLS